MTGEVSTWEPVRRGYMRERTADLLDAVARLTKVQARALQVLVDHAKDRDPWIWPAEHDMYGASFVTLVRRGLADRRIAENDTVLYRLRAFE